MEILNTNKPIPVKCNHWYALLSLKDYSSSTILFHHKVYHSEENLNYSPTEIACNKCLQSVQVSQVLAHNLACEKRLPKLALGTIVEEESGAKAICKYCKRRFALNRILKHELACEFSSKKRPVFDVSRKRSPLYNENSKFQIKPVKPNLVYPHSKWQKQHMELIKNLKCEGDDSYLTEYIRCTHCYRKFAPNKVEKHSEICKKIVNKPSGPANNPNWPAAKKLNKGLGGKSERALCRSSSVNLAQVSYQRTQPLLERNVNVESLDSSFSRLPELKNSENLKVPMVNCSSCGKIFSFVEAASHSKGCKQKLMQPLATFSKIFLGKISSLPARSNSTVRLQDFQDCTYCSAPFPSLINFCMICGRSK